MLGHGYWKRKFGGDSAALGQALAIDGRPHPIAGVMPQDLWFDAQDSLFLSIQMSHVTGPISSSSNEHPAALSASLI
jgi:hypothetical protein